MSLLTKIAHNNRLSLATRDIKQLQEIISSERRLVEQTQRLASERDKASTTLREWGNAEGPDLGDVLGKVSVLLEYLSKAELTFADHNNNYRLRFKEIRSKEENLSALKKSRDSLAGRIDAQERKVSKMKDENKDLPTQRQRLRDMQQEMIGLENTVLVDETRLSDFKRTATREALSLKLGAMLELAEKTVIVSELGKLIVDMLPVDETEPGQPRPYYEGHQRTEELLGEAQRCLQDVVFNPSPLTEGISHPPQHQQQYQSGQHDHEYQQYGDGSAHPTNQFDDSGIRAVNHASSEFGTHSPAGGQYAGNSYSSYQAPQLPPSQQHDQQGPHSGPQLQPLPDFRPLSVVTPNNGPSSARQPSYDNSGYAAQDVASSRSPTGPAAADSYGSRVPMLAPPVQDERYNPDRSSLAYMGEAPTSPSSYQQHHREPAVQEEDERALDGSEHAREVAEREAQQHREYEQGAQQHYQPEQQYEAYPYSPPVEQHHDAAADLVSAPADEHDDVARRDMHGEIPMTPGPLSPITEMPTPAPDQLAAGSAQQFTHEHPPAPTTPVTRSQPTSSHGHGSAEHVRSPSAESRYRRAAAVDAEPYSSPVAPAAPAYSAHASSRAPDVPTGPASPSGPTSPINPAFVHQPPPPSLAPSTFEPAPLAPKSTNDRRPIQLRQPSGEASLGSKYGDVFVPARAGIDGGGPYSPAQPSPRLASSSNPADAGLSGYFAPPSSSGLPVTPGGADQKRTIAASAFRRPQQQPPLQQAPYGAAGAGGSRFAASGYQYDPAAAAAAAAGMGPSESERIAAQWRDAGPPPEGHLGGEVQGAQVPSFDTRPLQVNKQRQGSMPGPGGVGRSGTLPQHLNGSHGRAPSLGAVEQAPYGEPRTSSEGLPRPAPPVGYAPPPNVPLSPGSQGGFASDRYVTRLD
ncbi:hypothetical protein JCM9279_002133 [Rhodotorula babjevae]